MTSKPFPDEDPAVDRTTVRSPADEQEDEQRRLDEEAHRELDTDPGAPEDRLDEPLATELMDEAQQRQFHA